MSCSAPEVRPAGLDDARAIAIVHVRSWQAAYRHVFPAAALDAISVDERERIGRRFLGEPEPRAGTLVAEDEGEIVAFASVGRCRDPDVDSETTGEVYAIYALPEVWGRGFGRALMDAAVARLERSGFAAATLWVLEDNPRARAFYEAAGWQLDADGTRTGAHLGTETVEVRYVARL